MTHDGVRSGSNELVSVAERQVKGKEATELVIAPRSHIRPHGDEQSADEEDRRDRHSRSTAQLMPSQQGQEGTTSRRSGEAEDSSEDAVGK